MRLLLLFVLTILPTLAFSSEWSGTVIGILDGDTIKVLKPNKKQIKIRLVEIDAPEKNQAYGTQSKQSLSEICYRKKVVINDKGTDKFNRTLGRIKCDGIDANAEQVKRGMAWAYKKYLTDQEIANLEIKARKNKLGLWADNDPIPPWDFRHNKNTVPNKNLLVDKTTSNNKYKCEGKTKCGQMINCDEAVFYLKECGLKRLDRDRDGVPCESLCK